MKILQKHKRFACLVIALLFFAVSFCPMATISPILETASADSIQPIKTETDSKTSYFTNYDSETIDDTYAQKQKPELFGDYDASDYPAFNNVMSLTDDKLDELITESIKIMDNVESDIQQNQLKKHKSADGQFFGAVSDEAPRITKTISINHMMSSLHWLGVFAPAGEILTVKIDEKAIEQSKNNDDNNKLSIIIGYPYWENNISKVDRNDDRYGPMKKAGRMPYLRKEFKLTQTEVKVGSPFGGMVFLSNVPGTVKQNFKITIEGGVDSPSYKLGVSEKSDWQKVLNSPSPMIFIQTQYVRFMAPKSYVQNVEDPDNALTFWNNAAMLSNYAMGLDTLSAQIRPVIMMFDSFVPGGSALCYPGLFAAICPTNWIVGSLNYKNLTTTAGGWGTIHEMNHNFQYPLVAGYSGSSQWSVGTGYNDYMEITNNVNNVMAFILYTDIASSRTETAPPSNGDWGVTVDPYYNLKRLLQGSQNAGWDDGFRSLGGDRIYAYVDLVHSYGVDKFLHFLRQMGGGEQTKYLTKEQTIYRSSYLRQEDNFAVFASQYFERDMVDYFTKTLHFNLSENAKEQIKNLNFKKHFSLQNLYAMGEAGALTGKPFYVDSNDQNIVLRLKDMTITDADNFEITSVSDVEGGSIVDNKDGTFTLTFDGDKATFNINYKVWDDGDSQPVTKTLVSCIQREVNFSVEATLFEYSKAADGTNIKQLIENKGESDIKRIYRAGNLSTSVENGESFTRLRANIVFPKDQQVTFMIYGDDATALCVGDQMAVCTTCVDYAYEFYYYNSILQWKDNKLTVQAKANQPILLEAYCLNTAGGGSIKVSYSVGDSNQYSGIMLTDCVNAEATEEEIEEFVEQEKTPHIYDTVYDLKENALDRMYTNSVDHTSDIESLKAVNENWQEVKNPEDGTHKVENIYDGKSNTWFSVPVNRYPLPHYYIFKFKEKISLNSATVRFYSSEYAIRGYEYYIGNSEDKNEWKSVLTRDNSASETSCVDNFATVTGQYFVIKVTKEGTNGRTNFVDVSFNQTLDEEEKTNIYSSKEGQFNYSANWKEQSGSYINGKAQATTDGEVSFVLEGEDLLLYSENDSSQIFIDDQKYVVEANDNIGQPSLFIQGLANTKHTVRIVGKNMVFDAVKTTGKVSAQTDLTTLDLQIANFEYDGDMHKPKITYDGKDLIENVDYVLKSCKKGQEFGKVDFQIEGIGFFKGEVDSSFNNILNVNSLSPSDIRISLTEKYQFSGEAIEPKPEISIYVEGELVNLTDGKDFEVQYSNNILPGRGIIKITFKGNFKGSSQTEFSIHKDLPMGFIEGLAISGTLLLGGMATMIAFLVKKKKKS